MTKKFTLGKPERLKSRKLIEQLFNGGKNFSLSPCRIYYLLQDHPFNTVKPISNLLLGVSVPVKNFKKAVDRNRIKRLIREAYRLQKNLLYEKLKASNQYLSVFIIYTGRELPLYKLVYDKMTVALQKLIQQVEQNSK